MKSTKSYGLIIKELLEVTDTKFTVLAKAVGYDISYISKWCNNIKIPSTKNIETVNAKLSLFFSDEIIKQGKTGEVYKLFEISDPLDESNKDVLYEQIYSILENGYKNSKSDLCQKSEKNFEDNKVVVGNKNVIFCLTELIKNTIQNSTQCIDFISTLDICKIAHHLDLDIIEEFKSNDIRINAKVGFDMNEFESKPDYYIPRVYFILNEFLNIDFDLYDNKEIDKLNIIAIRDKFAVLCSLDIDGMIEVATIVIDIDTVNGIYDHANAKFKTENILVKSAEFLGMDKGGYRTEFYSNDEFQFLSTRGFEFLLPSDIITEIINEAHRQGFNEDMDLLIRKIQITWEEVFEKSKINFIILKSALMKYIEDGEIFYAEVSYNLSPEQRKIHAQNVIECMRNNNDIKFTILDDELLNYKANLFKLSVYVNNKKIFLKKNFKSMSHSSNPLYYTIINDKLVRYINDYLISLRDKDYCSEFDVNATEKIVEKYGTMYLRLLDAQNRKKVSNI